ncbi:Y+L amino acid transporter 2 [Brachionus plicatilis]|uniref:Y+L amino acid transporter 2 n=1 Tax=Brachionus plicatilis TaxID=10195 RepID=A0A3M7SLR5_BRAPC|nr:Y+L amino acid transporter 2 [Brachionus plicatilis]
MAVELSPIKLKKGINFFTACTLIIGNIIGSGIFITSKGVLENSGSPIVSLLVWTMSGLLTLVGAYCYTELGTLIQTSGGDYAYINESYGRLASFLYTYMIVFVIFPCITAVFGITVSVYILRIFYEDCEAPRVLVRVVAAMTIILLSVLNMYKIKLVSKIQAAFTITKIFALLIIISMGVYNLGKRSDAIKVKVLNEWFPQDLKLNGIGMAFYNGLFAYSGWNCLNFLTEEMKEPEKNLPRALTISIPLITFIYLITNISYFLVLTPGEILSTEAVALTFSRKIFNQYVWLTPLFISFSTFGALSGCILGASRAYYASARDGNLPQLFALICIKNFTPITCIMLQAFMSIIILFMEDLDSLILYGAFTEILFISLSLSSIFYFRYRRPNAIRPIKVNLIFPIIFLIVCFFLLLLTLIQNPKEVLKSFLFVSTGIPVYFICIKWKTKPIIIAELSSNFF